MVSINIKNDFTNVKSKNNLKSAKLWTVNLLGFN